MTAAVSRSAERDAHGDPSLALIVLGWPSDVPRFFLDGVAEAAPTADPAR